MNPIVPSAAADIFVPDGLPFDRALARTTHLGIGAHADDLEIMAYAGIADCYRNPKRWFTGVVCADGSGSPRAGTFARVTDVEMREIRRKEQRRAAVLGEYSVAIQLGYPSSLLRGKRSETLVGDLETILGDARPGVIYTHDLSDPHATHVSVALHAIEAIRRLPAKNRPKKLYGCEVWRSLDWLPAGARVVLDAGPHPKLAASLLKVFRSQIAGGKNYGLATLARRNANATFREPNQPDRFTAVTFAMDLTPLITKPNLVPSVYMRSLVKGFDEEIQRNMRGFR